MTVDWTGAGTPTVFSTVAITLEQKSREFLAGVCVGDSSVCGRGRKVQRGGLVVVGPPRGPRKFRRGGNALLFFLGGFGGQTSCRRRTYDMSTAPWPVLKCTVTSAHG